MCSPESCLTCRQGRDCPARMTLRQKIVAALFVAAVLACFAIAIAYGDRAAIVQ